MSCLCSGHAAVERANKDMQRASALLAMQLIIKSSKTITIAMPAKTLRPLKQFEEHVEIHLLRRARRERGAVVRHSLCSMQIQDCESEQSETASIVALFKSNFSRNENSQDVCGTTRVTLKSVIGQSVLLEI